MATCINGHTNADSTKFCAECGSEISAVGPGRYCQTCGQATNGNAFCSACGSATSGQKMPSPDSASALSSMSSPVATTSSGGSASRKWIVGLSIAAAAFALLGAFGHGVNLPDGTSLNAFHLGANFSSTQFGGELISLGIASLLLAVRVKRIETWPTWSHWLRLALGVFWFLAARRFVIYCENYVFGFNSVSTNGVAAMGPAGGYGVIASLLYVAASIVNLVARRKKKNK